MPVPVFGWSAGDIVVSIKILIHVGKAFRESGGAKHQFAETSAWLVSFADDLDKVREFVDKYPDAKHTRNLRQQIAIIYPEYKKFEEHLGKFDPSLSSHPRSSLIKRSGKKFEWAFKELKGHVDGLKNSVSGPLASINLLLNLQALQDLHSVADQVEQLTPASNIADIKSVMQKCGKQLANVEGGIVDLHIALEKYRTIAGAFNQSQHDKLSINSAEIVKAQSDLAVGIISVVEQSGSDALQILNAISGRLELLQHEQHDGFRSLQDLLVDQQISTQVCQLHIGNIDQVLRGMRQERLQEQYVPATGWLTLLQTAGSVIGALTGIAVLAVQHKLVGNGFSQNLPRPLKKVSPFIGLADSFSPPRNVGLGPLTEAGTSVPDYVSLDKHFASSETMNGYPPAEHVEYAALPRYHPLVVDASKSLRSGTCTANDLIAPTLSDFGLNDDSVEVWNMRKRIMDDRNIQPLRHLSEISMSDIMEVLHSAVERVGSGVPYTISTVEYRIFGLLLQTCAHESPTSRYNTMLRIARREYEMQRHCAGQMVLKRLEQEEHSFEYRQLLIGAIQRINHLGEKERYCLRSNGKLAIFEEILRHHLRVLDESIQRPGHITQTLQLTSFELSCLITVFMEQIGDTMCRRESVDAIWGLLDATEDFIVLQYQMKVRIANRLNNLYNYVAGYTELALPLTRRLLDLLINTREQWNPDKYCANCSREKPRMGMQVSTMPVE